MTTEEDAYTRADKASLITEEQRQAYTTTRDRIRAEYLFSREHRPPTTGRGVHHVALISKDVETTVEWYQNVAGFPVTVLFENRDLAGSTHFFFDVGNGNCLAFFDLPGVDPGPYAEVLGGLHHLAISVPEERWHEIKGRLDDRKSVRDPLRLVDLHDGPGRRAHRVPARPARRDVWQADDLTRVFWWATTVPVVLVAAGGPLRAGRPARPDGRRRVRRRRGLHGALDGLLPGPRRPGPACRRAGAAVGGLRGVGAQRRVADELDHRRPGPVRAHERGRCGSRAAGGPERHRRRGAAVVEAEGIDAGVARGGELTVATNVAQWARVRAAVAAEQQWDDTGVVLLDADRARSRVAVPGLRGAAWQPHAARVHPARLVAGLASAAEARGVEIFEDTRVTALAPGRVETDRGPVTARFVVRATEGSPRACRGAAHLAPMNSSLVVTAPLPEPVWQEIGWAGRGGARRRRARLRLRAAHRGRPDRPRRRGVPYRFGSRLQDPRVGPDR
jgi:catechol 2,3-dioxygenase-like lactoylglutathione lyase family enzyme